jgi:2-(1,2-epoxy-1,2-dihydrophenyl)acetyl-CoA isomerase
MKEYKDIIFEKEGAIATITLNRPEKLNAITQEMRQELPDALEIVTCDDGIRVLIITGAGRGFCAGDDVQRQARLAEGEADRLMTRFDILYRVGYLALALHNLKKPTILR